MLESTQPAVRAPSPEFQPYGVIPVGEPTKKPDTRSGFKVIKFGFY
jgi:hypothetical protein